MRSFQSFQGVRTVLQQAIAMRMHVCRKQTMLQLDDTDVSELQSRAVCALVGPDGSQAVKQNLSQPTYLLITGSGTSMPVKTVKHIDFWHMHAGVTHPCSMQFHYAASTQASWLCSQQRPDKVSSTSPVTPVLSPRHAGCSCTIRTAKIGQPLKKGALRGKGSW
jgi:hypothetical protein